MEYVCFFDGRSVIEGGGTVQGQALDVGMRGGRRDGGGVCRRPWRRPESGVPAAMVAPQSSSEAKVTNHSNSYVEISSFLPFFVR